MSKFANFSMTIVLGLTIFGVEVFGQAAATSQLEDAYTPPSLSKGTHPLGSYGGGSFDSVNFFNGNLSMSFPLAGLDGRAGMGAGVALTYNSKFWHIQTTSVPNSDYTNVITYYFPVTQDWDRTGDLAPGWRIHAGMLIGRTTGFGARDIGQGPNGFFHYQQTLTRYTFIAPDGTEYEFRDTPSAWDGALFQHGSDPNQVVSTESRGWMFKTSDGTAATFIMDPQANSDGVHDVVRVYRLGMPAPIVGISGMVYLRDGTRFRIENSQVKWQMDRNGNRITFEYDGNSRLTKVYDTLGRQITIEYFNGDENTVLARITVQGVNNQTRTVEVRRGWLRNNRTDGSGAPTKGELFGYLDWNPTESYDVPTVSRIVMPSQHEWSFKYNKYAEVSRVITPGGGVVDYENDFGAMDNSGQVGTQTGPVSIFRRIKKRTIYPNGLGQPAERVIQYSDPSVGDLSTDAVVDETHSVPGGGAVARIKHYFTGTPREGLFSPESVLNGTGYSRWSLGRETKTETYDVVNGNEVRKAWAETTWEQRADVQWATNLGVLSAKHPQNDTRVKSAKNVLTAAGTNSVSKTDYQYDQFNNVKQEDVFDYGVGVPGGLLRQVRRTFRTAAGDEDYWDATVDGKVLVPGTSERRNVHLRSLVATESVWSSTAAETTTTYEYDVYTGTNRASLVDRTLPETPYRLHGLNYGPTWQLRGNVTSATVSGPNLPAAVASYTQYDVCGSLVKAIGPLGASQTTTFAYDPVSGDPAQTYNYAYPTSVSRPVTEADGTPKTLTMSYVYDFWTGNVKEVRGYNYAEGLTSDVATYEYSDSLDRLTAVQRPTGAGRTEYVYSPSGQTLGVTTRTLRESSPAQWDESTTTFDGLFRATTTTRTDPGPGGLVEVDTKYDTLGRPWLVSNPFRPGVTGPDPTDGWTRTFYDALGRATDVSTFNGRTMPDATWTDQHANFTGKVTTDYNGASVTVTDQSGKQRKTDMDSLQRIKAVYEPTSSGSLTQATTYAYDARGNLTLVQQGVQQRKFAYDALSRLINTKMPEQTATINDAGGPWSQRFVYDAASNLLSKTESRSGATTITSSYTYDEVNRVRTIDYSNTPSTTHDVVYFYDMSGVPSTIANAGAVLPAGYTSGYSMGRLRGVATNATTGSDPVQSQTANIYSYDAAGRAQDYWQLLDGQHYHSSTVYNAASQVKQETYPSGALVVNDYTTGGFLSKVRYTPLNGSQTTISDSLTYSPAGAISEQKLGNGLWHTIAYNSRLQPLSIGLGTNSTTPDRLKLEYDYGRWDGASEATGLLPDQTANNGNIGRITITPGTGSPMSQYFQYDELNRLSLAREYATGGGASTVPTLLSAMPGNQQVALTWSAISGATGYRVKRAPTSGGPYTTLPGSITATSFTDTGLTNGTTYYYVVVAIVNGVDSANSNELSATPTNSTGLTAPVLQSASPGNQQVDLTWTAVSSAASYKVKRATVSGGSYTTIMQGLTGTTYSDTGVTNNTTYYYVVSAVSATGVESANSNQLSATPSATAQIPVAPTNLIGVALSSTSIQLTWTDNSTDETGFEVLRSPAGLGAYQVVSGTLPPNTTSWTNTGVQSGASYDYIVRAVRNGVYSANSNTANVTANSCTNLPATPQSLQATGYSMVQINLTWVDASTNETGFSIERKTGTGAYVVVGTASANATAYQDTGLAAGTTYQYRIRAVNTCGYSAYSNGVSRTTPTQPQPPTNVTVTALSWNSIRVSWTDGSVEEIGFRIRRREGTTGSWVTLPDVPANSTSFVDTGLTPNTTYYYRVASVGPGGTTTSAFIPTLANVIGATTAQAPGTDTVGIYDATGGTWFLRNSNSSGAADAAFYYGPIPSTWTPVKGDFDGDGDDSIGLYDPSSGYFYLRNSNGPGAADLQFSFGPGGLGWVPLIGDWDADGTDSVGLYDPSTSAFYLKNANSAGAADIVFYFGVGGFGWKPLVGDWDNDGTDSIGLYDPSNGNFFLKNANTYGAADVTFSFGLGGWTPLTGDWNGDGQDSVGLYDPSAGAFYLKNVNDYGAADLTFFYGPANVLPIMGDWDNTGQLRPEKARASRPSEAGRSDASSNNDERTSAIGVNGAGSRRRRGAGRSTESTVSWTQAFDYDRYGNRTWNAATTSNVQGPAIATDAATNRINTAGYTYDDAGNLTAEPGKSHQYDAMNKIWKTTIGAGSGATTVTMVYDAAGQRVKKIVQVGQAAPTTTRFIYGMGGGLIAEHTTSTAPTSPSKEYVYGPTGLAATVDNPTTAGRVIQYLTPDHLGSPRIVTGGTTGAATVVSRHDYLPFGEELFAGPNGQPGIGGRTTGQGYAPSTQTDGVRQQFTSKERDTETGLDYFGARFLSSIHGRFLSADPELITVSRLSDPQRINLYVYARNNPEFFVDLDGRDIWGHISKDPAGTTMIRLIQPEGGGAPKKVAVNYYVLSITDSVTGEVSTYNVTRDGPVLDSANGDGTFNVINTTFEPSTNKDPRGWTNYRTQAANFPPDTNLTAWALREENGSSTLDAEPNPNADRKKSDKATEITLHVGGDYTKNDGSPRTTGSLGCFTLCGKDGGNAGNKRFTDDINRRLEANRKKGKGTNFYIQIEKRPNPVLQWTVDGTGNAIR